MYFGSKIYGHFRKHLFTLKKSLDLELQAEAKIIKSKEKVPRRSSVLPSATFNWDPVLPLVLIALASPSLARTHFPLRDK